jgi:hypothetical protein
MHRCGAIHRDAARTIEIVRWSNQPRMDLESDFVSCESLLYRRFVKSQHNSPGFVSALLQVLNGNLSGALSPARRKTASLALPA